MRAMLAVMTLAVVGLAGCTGSGASGDGMAPAGQPLWQGPDATMRILGDPLTSATVWPAAIDAGVLVHDVDLDGEPEFIVTGKDRLVRVYAADGTVRAEIPLRLPPSWHVDNIMNRVVAAELSPNSTSLVVSTPAGGVQAWTFMGRDGETFRFEPAWEMRIDGCHRSPGMDATPAVADVDGDGLDELFTQAEQQGLFGIDHDGSVMWKHCWAGGNADAVPADLDHDGDIEVVFAGDNGFLAVLDGQTGAPQWTFDARDEAYGIFPASIPVAPTIADLDGEGALEVLFTARHAPHDTPGDYGTFHMAIFAVHQNLTDWQPELVWMRQPDWAHPLSYTRLEVQDVDGDGRMDIFGMDWNTIGHRPGAWEQLGDAHLFRLDALGDDVWVKQVEAWWSNKDIVLVDADDDDATEILAVGPNGAAHGIWRIDASDGDREGFLSVGGLKVARGPSMAAVDGRLHVAAPVVSEHTPPRSGVALFDLGVPA